MSPDLGMTKVREPGDLTSVQKIEVLRVVVLTGRGERGSVVRNVTYYFDAATGDLIHRDDPQDELT